MQKETPAFWARDFSLILNQLDDVLTIRIDHERQVVLLGVETGVHNCEATITQHLRRHSTLCNYLHTIA